MGTANQQRWLQTPWALNDRRMKISPSGKVQIGLAQAVGTPHDDYKLAVDGKLVARSVQVTQQNWADFVFAPTYRLLPLPELEQYLEAHRHLPAIPSAPEVAANGLDLGDMSARLLQTVEELTLHVIALGKQNEQLRAEVAELARQVRPAYPAVGPPASR